MKLLALTGGVPRYLEEIDPSLDAESNISRIAFDASGPLFGEFDRIFSDIFDRRANTYRNIMETLVEQKLSFQQICMKMGQSKNGTVSSYLADLESSGFLSRDYSFDWNANPTKFSVFRIKDNYLRFYLKYIRKHELRIRKGIFRLNQMEKLPNWEGILGLQFENTILNNIDSVIEKLGIARHKIVNASPYFQPKNSKNKGACQVDLLIHTDSGTLYICEIKFRKKITTDVIAQMEQKIEVLKRPRQMSIRTVLIYDGTLDPGINSSGFFDRILTTNDLVS